MSQIITFQPVQYLLFSTDKFITFLPEAFVYSNNERNISVIAAHAFYVMTDDYGNPTYTKPEYWQLHASFVQEGDFMNHYVCLFNHPLFHKQKYKQANRVLSFKIWVTDYNGNIIEPNENLHIIVELLLQY